MFFWSTTRLVVPKSPEADPRFDSFSVGPVPLLHRPCAGCYGKVAVHRLDLRLHPQDLTCRGRRWQKPETHAGRWVRCCEGKKMGLSRDHPREGRSQKERHPAQRPQRQYAQESTKVSATHREPGTAVHTPVLPQGDRVLLKDNR